jgi:hypothetical protein
MIKNLSKITQKTAKEAKLWAYAAWTLPFVALALLVFENFIGWDHIYKKTLVVIASTFFAISVFWWWWALNRIVTLLQGFQKTDENFENVKKELQEAKELIIEYQKNVGDR